MPPDMDPEDLERVRDDFERALAGKPRPLPKVPGIPRGLVQEIVEAEAEAYRGMHRPIALVFWARVEPIIERRLAQAGRELAAAELLPGDEWRAEATLEECASDLLDLLDDWERRLAVEMEVHAEGEHVDITAVARSMSAWAQELG